jgi:hypothetical protein
MRGVTSVITLATPGPACSALPGRWWAGWSGSPLDHDGARLARGPPAILDAGAPAGGAFLSSSTPSQRSACGRTGLPVDTRRGDVIFVGDHGSSIRWTLGVIWKSLLRGRNSNRNH